MKSVVNDTGLTPTAPRLIRGSSEAHPRLIPPIGSPYHAGGSQAHPFRLAWLPALNPPANDDQYTALALWAEREFCLCYETPRGQLGAITLHAEAGGGDDADLIGNAMLRFAQSLGELGCRDVVLSERHSGNAGEWGADECGGAISACCP